MADSTESETGTEYLDHIVLALIDLIPGLVIHSFIIGVNVTDWWKGRSVTPVDHIVTSLGISRMGTQCVAVLYQVVDSFLSSLDPRTRLDIIGIVYALFMYANAWLTSLLSIVLCLKISNFHTGLFLYLRGTIAHRTVYFIVATVLLSAVNSLIPLLASIEVTKGGTFNKTMANLSIDCPNALLLYNVTVGFSIPLILYYISSVLLFTSLYHHTTKMKKSSNLSINLETYYSVMRFVFFNFIYNTVYSIGYVAYVLYYYFYCASISWLFLMLGFLSVLHSSYLIYRTAKLRSQMSKILHNVIDFLIPRKSTETRENIEVVSL